MIGNDLTLLHGRSESEVVAAILDNPALFDRIEKTPECCLAIVGKNGNFLGSIPKGLQTKEICEAAVRQNGSVIKYVSKKLITDEICLIAVENNGNVLRWIPQEFYTPELLFTAVRNNGLALRYIPLKLKTYELCLEAVKQNGLVLEYVPTCCYEKALFETAIKQNGLALQFVHGNRKTKNLCMMAMAQNPLALEFVLKRLLTTDVCKAAISRNWQAFAFIPVEMMKLENCLTIYRHILSLQGVPFERDSLEFQGIIEIARRLPAAIHKNKKIIEIERKLDIRAFTDKYYDSSTRRFHVTELISYIDFLNVDQYEEHVFKKFDAFYRFLGGDINGINLCNYDFKGIDLSGYNIRGACLSSDVLINMGLYDDSFYEQAVGTTTIMKPFDYSQSNELVAAESVLHDTDICESLNDTTRKIYYISDLHLNHKLKKRFPEHATKDEITDYINLLVDTMFLTAKGRESRDYLLVAGDVSFSFQVASIFYTALSQHWNPKHIIVVLGNHDLWDYTSSGERQPGSSLQSIIAKYRELLNDLDIIFLQNDLFIEYESTGYVIPEEKLSMMDASILKTTCLQSSFFVFGGLGFSGNNKEFNATNGIYRDTITTLEADRTEMLKFQSLYNRLSEILQNEHLIILTHMPKSDWSDQEYNRYWIYVNGHTHKNEYSCDESKKVYADNQIGYRSITMGLKYFKLATEYDIFQYLTDGIYQISREKYLGFNRGVGISTTFNRVDGQIYMLKRDGIYCFLYKRLTGTVYLLNGGMIKKVENEDVNYYFDKIPYYASAIQKMLSGYYSSLKSLANAVKRIGGTGTIHGCIVDVDYYNHIFVNPQDGTITPYHALSITEKYVFQNVDALLKNDCPFLYENYLKLCAEEKNSLSVLNISTLQSDTEIAKFVAETYMYNPSRVMKTLQYLTEVHVIRVWNDKVLNVGSQIFDGMTSPALK